MDRSLRRKSDCVPGEGYCSNCSHWSNAEADWQFDKLVMGRCAAIRQREDIVEPARDLCGDWDAREAEEERLLMAEKAIAVDGSGYYAAIRTAPDFGCVLWKARTAAEADAVGMSRQANAQKAPDTTANSEVLKP